QVQGVAKTVGRRRPAFSQPRLDLPGRAIDAHQLTVGEPADQIEGAFLRHQPVEGSRTAADGGDEGASRSSGGRRRVRAPRASSARDGRSHDERRKTGSKETRLSAQMLAKRPKNWPLEIVCT